MKCSRHMHPPWWAVHERDCYSNEECVRSKGRPSYSRYGFIASFQSQSAPISSIIIIRGNRGWTLYIYPVVRGSTGGRYWLSAETALKFWRGRSFAFVVNYDQDVRRKAGWLHRASIAQNEACDCYCFWRLLIWHSIEAAVSNIKS